MTASVPNPAGSALLRAKYLGSLSYSKAGAYTVPCPSGTKLVRFSLRGGGGGAGSYSGGGYGGYGGGQGALTRKFIAYTGSSLALVVGAGGLGQISGDGTSAGAAAAGAGGNSTLDRYTANGGGAGRRTTTAEAYTQPPAGGAGADGAQTPLGYGNYAGLPASSTTGGGGGNSLTYEGSSGSLGAGGNGSAVDYKQMGGSGGDGYCYLEFFG